MIKDLIKLANRLDNKGLTKEADTLDNIINKIAQEDLKKIGRAGVEAIRKFLSMAYQTTVTADEGYNVYKYNDLETVEDAQGAFPVDEYDNIKHSIYKLTGCDSRCFDHLANPRTNVPVGNELFIKTMEDENTLAMRYSKNFKIKVEKQDGGNTLICTAEIE
jgi:hypothetical protein